MKITFISNYLNVHQRPFCDAMISNLGTENFSFVACTPFNQMRLNSGYSDMNHERFVIRAYEDSDAARQAAFIADVVIGMPYAEPDLIGQRLEAQSSGLTFVYSERLLKRGRWMRFLPQKIDRVNRAFSSRSNLSSFHVLCASAFTSYDLSFFHFPSSKCWKWGYFPKVPNTNISTVVHSRPISIVWIGRLIDWKRPFLPLHLAKRLRSDGRSFHLTMIGDGRLHSTLERYIDDNGLSESVTLMGTVANDVVHEILAGSDVFLFTSNRKEGWGAVLNEAMGHGCAPVASSAAGSTPYLIEDGKNGRVYADGDEKGLYQCVVDMIDNPLDTRRMRENAYSTMVEHWNPDCAAQRIIELSRCLISGDRPPYTNGPCSAAHIISDSWFGEGRV